MAAPKGNKNAVKLKTQAQKDAVYKDYCDHLSKGGFHKAWSYNKGGLLLSWVSIETYLKNDPDFDPLQKIAAEASGLKYWIELGKSLMLGKVDKCQPAIYQIFMRNLFGWDKKDSLSDKDQASLIVKAVHYAIESKSKPVKTIDITNKPGK